MSLRLLCVISLFWVRGWWLLLVGVGAVVLPYFAVLIANAVSNQGGTRPEGVPQQELTAKDSPPATPTVIIVDTPEKASNDPR